jgi:nitroreductase
MFSLQWIDAALKTYGDLKSEAKQIVKSRAAKTKKKSSKQEGLFKQVHKTLSLLQTNPKHAGLQTHEYTSIENPYDSKQKVFEAYAQNKTPGAYRVFWCYGPGKNEITIIAITPHP